MIETQVVVANARKGRAAEYIRKSTDDQQYSIAYQQAAIRLYAVQHNLVVVRTYADEGKSGLDAEGRQALLGLIADVTERVADFEAILVYDVSRWGRFQDIDESAYYEFICRRAGVRVEYTGELFKNDGGIFSAVLKSLKRAMAAEWSRERSVRIHLASLQMATRGYFTGGTPGYGFRRMLVGPHGERKGILERGQYRALRCDHMILVPGPDVEVKIVRRIFRMFAERHVLPDEIAARLNRQKINNDYGRAWNGCGVRAVLRNRRYIGTSTYNCHSGPLKSKRVKNAPAEWICVEKAFEGIVSPKLFEKARSLLVQRTPKQHSREDLLDRLRMLLAKNGRLSTAIVRNDASPDYRMYYKKFGGLRACYALIGYQQKNDWHNVTEVAARRVIALIVLKRLKAALRSHGATLNLRTRIVTLTNGVAITVKVAKYFKTPREHFDRWRLHITRRVTPDFTVVVRLASDNRAIHDFYVLPRSAAGQCKIRIDGPCWPDSVQQFRRRSLLEVAGTIAESRHR
jgi:DNA invertase Pin-like site-specific DNA recombinase